MIRIFSLFLACSLTSFLWADMRVVYYNHPLALTYLKSGETHFLGSCLGLPDQEYKDALQDLINLAAKNSIDIPSMLKDLKITLQGRINRIERLKGKTVDWENIYVGSALTGAGGAGSYGLYCIYKKYYRPYYHDEKSQRIWQEFFCLGGFGIVALTGLGFMFMQGGLFPSRWDDHYLDQYATLLQITNEFIQQHCPQGNIAGELV